MIDTRDARQQARPDEPTPQQRRGMRLSIGAQCCGSVAQLVFQYNIILLYLTAAGVSEVRIVVYLSLPMLIESLRVPLALMSDRWGKKRIGTVGQISMVVGFGGLVAAGWLGGGAREAAMVGGIVLYSSGFAAMSSSWFALLSPIVPEGLRGRFFGKLRVSWQTVGILFAGLCALTLTDESPVGRYQLLLGLIVAGLAARAVIYTRIPEMEPAPPSQRRLRDSVRDVLQAPGYMSFCAYVFLLTLATLSCPTLFGLVEKKVMNLGDWQVAWLGNLMMMGSLAGFFVGGRAVDRWGTKPVFLVCHFGYGVILALFVGRALVPAGALYVVGALRVLFGMVYAASTIAISSELLSLIPPENKSLSTSIASTMNRLSGAVAGLLFAGVLEVGMLRSRWELWGMEMSQYDGLLLACAIMVVVLVVTLGLVPSVIGRAQYLPRTD